MATSESAPATVPGNDLMLLERVFLRLGSADSDEQLETCVGKFLPPVLLKLASPNEQVRTKVMELLVHINKRVRCRSEVQLPIDALLLQYQDPQATSFVINFTIIYLTMGFPRLAIEKQIDLIPRLLSSIASRPQSHQDDILLLVMPMLGDLGNKASTLNLKERPEQAKLLLRLALDLLLLPYGALPGNKESGPDFPVPPGMSPQSYKRLTEKNSLTAEQLEKTKQSIVKFLTNDAVEDSETLLPLIVAAADSRFSVANIANVGLGRLVSAVDWSSSMVCGPLYTLFLGSNGPRQPATPQRRAPACTRIRLKLLQYLNKATAAGILYPHCIQVIFASLFATNTNPRLKTLALNFTMNIIQSGDITKLKRIAPVLLGGLLKLTKIEEEWSHHAQAFTCIGRLAAKAPNAINKQFETLEELFNKMPDASPELRMAIREALLAMAMSFKIKKPVPIESNSKDEPMEVCASSAAESKPGTSMQMEVDEPIVDEGLNENHGNLIVILLDKHMDNDDSMVRFVAARYASVLFPKDHIASKYLLLLASGDIKDEVKMEALKSLYGTTRQNEIEDMVQNVTPQTEQKTIKNDEKVISESARDSDAIGVPSFEGMVQYIWTKIIKRKESSNLKHRFVTGNNVLPFSPSTYYEILRYLRMCLNRDAGIKDGSPHPSSSSPMLMEYLNKNLLTSEALQHYISMVKILLTASPDIMPFTCLLDIVGCIPQKMAPDFVDQLPFFQNHFTNSMREEIRDTAALLYAIIKAHTTERQTLERDIMELIDKSKSTKSLESQCGFIAAYCNLLERSITLWKTKTLNVLTGNDFKINEWKPYKIGVSYLADCLSNSHNLIVSSACINISLLGKCYALPLLDSSDNEKDISSVLEDQNIESKAKDTEKKSETDEITKLGLINKLFGVLKCAKYSSKIKERATAALGIICVGEHFPFSKLIIKGFLDMAKETKDFEIHLQIGESLVLCVEGINSHENRDTWSQPLAEGAIRDNQALVENDKLLDWLLTELLEFVNIPHPNSRQACCIWLLALLRSCPKRNPVKSRLSIMQDAFMEFLSENSEIVQDVASKGLSLVYQSSSEADKKELVEKLVEQLAGGKRQVAQVTQDTKVFEEGQLGKTPTGGNLSTYKELCSFASDLNQPDLIYKFMHLANHNAMWNSKKGAAFGFHSIAQQAGTQLSEHLPKIVPRLYRYRFDPTPKIQNSMSSIWHALVPETQKTVEKYHAEILSDIITNLTASQWRIRISCCLALSDLLRVSKGLHESQSRLEEIWSQLFRVMDDVHEGTRTAAANTSTVLSKLCVRATEIGQGKAGKEIVAAILPVLLNTGITNTVAEIRQISLQTVSKLVASAGTSLKPFLPQLIPALLQATGELESAKLSHLSAMLGGRHQSQEMVDSARAQAAKSHYTTETVAKCIQYIDIATFEAMLPSVLELMKSPQLGTKVACTHLFILITHQLGKEIMPLAGKIMSSLVNNLLDRNAAVRKNCADALGNIVGCAKDSSIDKLLLKLNNWYKERDDEAVRSAIALTLQAIANRNAELLKEKSNTVMPMLFFAMHAEKTADTKTTVELYEEVWSDISPGKEQGIRKNLSQICDCLKETLNSPSWTMKTQTANAIATVASEMKTGLGDQRQVLMQMLLEALKGRTWEGKEKLLQAIANLCKCANEEENITAELAELVIDSVMRECGKQDPSYKRHCLAALGEILVVLKKDRFEQVYNILHDTLAKDVSSIGKDSDDDEYSNAEALKKREQLIALKEVSYETLGKAWPDSLETQGKYQKVFASHCSECIKTNTRSVQVSILSALKMYVEKLILLNDASSSKGIEKMEVDANTDISSDLKFIITQIISVLDYAFDISKHTRLRKEALDILSILGKNLKDSSDTSEFSDLKNLYSKYEGDLGKDSAPEIRSRMVHIKVIFQDK